MNRTKAASSIHSCGALPRHLVPSVVDNNTWATALHVQMREDYVRCTWLFPTPIGGSFSPRGRQTASSRQGEPPSTTSTSTRSIDRAVHSPVGFRRFPIRFCHLRPSPHLRCRSTPLLRPAVPLDAASLSVLPPLTHPLICPCQPFLPKTRRGWGVGAPTFVK